MLEILDLTIRYDYSVKEEFGVTSRYLNFDLLAEDLEVIKGYYPRLVDIDCNLGEFNRLITVMETNYYYYLEGIVNVTALITEE